MLKILDCNRFLDASLDRISTMLKSFPFLDENGMEDDLYKRKKAYPYGKSKSNESFYKQLKVSRKDYFST